MVMGGLLYFTLIILFKPGTFLIIVFLAISLLTYFRGAVMIAFPKESTNSVNEFFKPLKRRFKS